MAVTAATMKKEKKSEPAATTFVNYLESWYQNKYLPNSTSNSTDAYYHWMIFNVIESSLPDKERAVDDINAEYLNALLACINQKNENTAASAYRFLRVFIKDSFEPDTGDYELFFQIKKYSVLEKDPVLYTPEQLTCLLSAAKKDITSHYLEYALALYCGLKLGEILGLKYISPEYISSSMLFGSKCIQSISPFLAASGIDRAGYCRISPRTFVCNSAAVRAATRPP